MSVSSTVSTIVTWAFGVLLAGLGTYVVIADVHLIFHGSADARTINLWIGCGLIFTGGLIIVPAPFKAIIVLIAPYLPIIGGRRQGDPPGDHP